MSKEKETEKSAMSPEVEQKVREAIAASSAKEAPARTEDDRLRELIESPLSLDDAKKELATNDIEKMKLLVIRQKWETQQAQVALNLASLDEKLRLLDMDRAVILRRTMNVKAAE